MDGRGSTATEVTIQAGRFTAVGPRGNQRLSPCTRDINLRGRTVVPGLIDNHNHIVLLGIRPGYHTPLESAGSIAASRPSSRHARRACPQADSSRQWAGGTRLNSLRSVFPRWPSSTRRRRIILFCLPVIHRAFIDQHPGTGVLHRKGDRGQRDGCNRSECPFTRGVECAASCSNVRRQEARHVGCDGIFRARWRHDECRHGGLQPAGNTGPPGLVRGRHTGQCESVPHVRCLSCAPQRAQDDDEAARLLPDHGHAARDPGTCRTPAQQLQRVRR